MKPGEGDGHDQHAEAAKARVVDEPERDRDREGHHEVAEVRQPRGVVVPVRIALVPQLALQPHRRRDASEQPLVEAELRVDVGAPLQGVGELVQHRVRDHDERAPAASRGRRATRCGPAPPWCPCRDECTSGPERVPVPSTAMWVKICGITNEEDALLAVALGADALGFNFAPGSPRQVAPDTVAEILHRLPPGVVTVGVFRDESPERVVELVNTLGLSGRAAPRPRAGVRRPLGAPPGAVRDPGIRRRRPRAGRGRQRPRRHRARRRRRAGFGRRVRLGARRRGARRACGCCSRAACTRATWRRRSSGSGRGASTSAAGSRPRRDRARRTRGSCGASSPRPREAGDELVGGDRVGSRSQGRALRLDGRR